MAAFAAAPGARAEFLDQINTPTPQQNNNIGSFEPIGQEFVPLFNRPDIVRMRVADVDLGDGPGVDMRERIREDTIAGTIVGESAVALLCFARRRPFPRRSR